MLRIKLVTVQKATRERAAAYYRSKYPADQPLHLAFRDIEATRT